MSKLLDLPDSCQHHSTCRIWLISSENYVKYPLKVVLILLIACSAQLERISSDLTKIRLLDVRTLELGEFSGLRLPNYAILLHIHNRDSGQLSFCSYCNSFLQLPNAN
jgi:hypothetical protein